MTAITHSIEISRSPEEVFAYLDDLARHGEWQEQVTATRVEPAGATGIGTRAVETRRVGNRKQTFVYEITEHDPPRSFAFRGVSGQIRPIGKGTVAAIADGRSRVTIELDFSGHGLGRLMLPMVRNQARKQVAKDQRRLKQRLEGDDAA
ncbi:MAG TPA: SRPBCC family protein [Gaiellales bacterium]|nr:SRPBCC family protein [Gaiellales bacterium]